VARSNKPLIWLPFAAGGMLAALVLPALALVLLLDAVGLLPAAALGHDRISAFADHALVKSALLVVIGLAWWHAAHRLRMTAQDLGVRQPGPRRLLAWTCYLVAAAGTAALAIPVIG